MEAVVEAKAIHIPICASSYYLSVILRNHYILNMIREGEEMESLVVDGVIYKNMLFFIYS